MSDISMPGRDGLDLLSDVRARNPQAVVVMISGLQNQCHTIEALRRGAFDYITKPFRLAEVECGIERALKHQALIEANRRYGEHLEGMVSERTNQLRQVNLKVNEMFEALYINYRATLQALAAALEARCGLLPQARPGAGPGRPRDDRARTRGAAPRHRQDRGARSHPAQAGPADPRRVGTDAPPH